MVNPPSSFSVHIEACSDLLALANARAASMATIVKTRRGPDRAIDTKCLGIGFSVTRAETEASPDKSFARALLVDAAGLGKFVRFQGGALRLRDRSRPEVVSLHGRDRHVDRLLCEAAEAGIELEIIAGDLLARGDVDDGVAFVENAEIGVRPVAVVHELRSEERRVGKEGKD